MTLLPGVRRAALLLLPFVLAAATAWAGDAAAAKRYIDAARGYIRSASYDGVEEELKKAEAQLEGLDASVKDPLVQEIAAVREESRKSEIENGTRRLTSSLERMADSGHRSARGGLLDALEIDLKKIEDELANPDNQKYLTDDLRKRFQGEMEAIRRESVTARLEEMIAKATEIITDAEERMAKPRDDFNTDDYIASRVGQAENWIKDAPKEEPRIKALAERIAKAKAAVAGHASSADRDETIRQAVDAWASYKDSYAAESAGWEDEKEPPSYEDFLRNSPVTLNVEKTGKRHSLAMRWLESDLAKTALQRFPDDAALKKVRAEVEAMRDDSSAKICRFAGAILDAAEKEGPKQDLGMAESQISQLVHIVKMEAAGSPDQAKTIARAEGLVKKWEGEKSASEGAQKALIEKLTAGGAALWKEWESSFDEGVTLDAAAALEDPGAWKGKTWKAQRPDSGGYWNALGYGWWPDDYEFVVVINGIPVAGRFDPAVLAAMEQIEKATGLDRRDFDAQALVAVVDGTCKVERREKRPFSDQEMIRAGSEPGVLIRIIAYRAGPFTAAQGKESSLSKADPKMLPNPKAAEGGPAGSAEGGGWLLRLMSWFESLLLMAAAAGSMLCGGAKYVPAAGAAHQKLRRPIAMAGAALAAFGVAWCAYTLVICDFLPSVMLVLNGAFLASDLLREKGKMPEETWKKIQPLGIVLGPAAAILAVLHLALWDKYFL